MNFRVVCQPSVETRVLIRPDRCVSHALMRIVRFDPCQRLFVFSSEPWRESSRLVLLIGGEIWDQWVMLGGSSAEVEAVVLRRAFFGRCQGCEMYAVGYSSPTFS